MNTVTCPHCGERRIITSLVPKDVVVVLPCPACNELVVLFHKKVVALRRDVIERGTFDQRKNHIAEVIAQFLEAGIFGLGARPHGAPTEDWAPEEGGLEAHKDGPSPYPDTPISQSEVERFVKVDLQRIDEPTYFKKHFGE